jgi:predicted TIM-barrel fold metal-dependent hydrolase
MIDVKSLFGRMNDLDTHIQPSPLTYEIAAGELGRQFGNMYKDLLAKLPPDEAAKIAERSTDEVNVYNDDTVWKIKGSAAPGSFTPEGRIKTLDYMGVNRSMIISDIGIQGEAFSKNTLSLPTMRHWNDFAINYSKTNRDRLRMVAILNTHDIDVATAEAERVLKAGGNAFVLASSVPPGGLSPAHEKMDKLWGMIQEANATAILHLGGEGGFLGSDAWSKGIKHLGVQETDVTSEGDQMDTYTFSWMHFSAQNFISAMVLGGVFEKFPHLRFAAVELGAHWFGPMAKHLDTVAHIFRRRIGTALSMKPSEYIRRNIRVTPYYFEPVADFIEHHGMDECYCYSSDFPHPEGGSRPLQEFTQRIERLGQVNAEKFFVTNSDWVLPKVAA